MHSSKILRTEQFQFLKGGEVTPSNDVYSFCPEFHEDLRLGVVSPCMEDGILGAGLGVMSFVTAFYDIQRSKSEDFFIYPKYFCFLGGSENGIHSRYADETIPLPEAGGPWGNLDVWPESQWMATDGTVTGAIEKTCECEIDYLFWPESFRPRSDDDQPGDELRERTAETIHAIFLFGCEEPEFEVRANHTPEELLERSIEHLPAVDESVRQSLSEERQKTKTDGEFAFVERYRQLMIDEFLFEFLNT